MPTDRAAPAIATATETQPARALTQHPGYRPDVDGLRALAVLAVIVFHARATAMPGGFAGVDVFFVISGFLITGLIARHIEQGDFSFANFYTRRIKRLLPAYLVVSIATLAVASWLLIPRDYMYYTTSLAASWGFAANVFFSLLSWGYFSPRTEEFPLLHTWSLSVEEQFYFLFPVLLIALYRYARRWLLPILVLMALLIVTWSQLQTGKVATYFLLTSRGHELLIGSLAFYFSRREGEHAPWLANLMALVGLAMVLASFVLLDKTVPFPGLRSLLPCLGTALLLYAGRQQHVLRAWLASPLMVGIGLISYSLYLWHWPIFAFLRYRQVEMTVLVALAAVALAFLLSWLTWKYVEQPVRHARNMGFRVAAFRYYALPAAACLAIGAFSYLSGGAPQRFPGELRELISSYSFKRDLSQDCSIKAEHYRKFDEEFLDAKCSFGAARPGRADLLLIGDSHADHFKPFVDVLAQDAGIKAVYNVQGVCFPIYLPGHPGTVTNPYITPTCPKRNEDMIAMAGSYRYVVLAGAWASEDVTHFEDQLTIAASAIRKAGAIPVIFQDNPSHEPDLSQCVLHRARGWIPASTDCNIARAKVDREQQQTTAAIRRVAEKIAGTIIIDPLKVMCDREKCPTRVENLAVYKDSNHINEKAAGWFARRYVETVGNPLGQVSSSQAPGPRAVQ
ncbi:MAG: hypothetical protein JWP36_2127 [Paucimonas sp.]|nr:hypothetical protein [Paucimonas sp.]